MSSSTNRGNSATLANSGAFEMTAPQIRNKGSTKKSLRGILLCAAVLCALFRMPAD